VGKLFYSFKFLSQNEPEKRGGKTEESEKECYSIILNCLLTYYVYDKVNHFFCTLKDQHQ
jgi:hypothetical protein